MDKNKVTQILNLLIENEEAIEAIYSTYAIKFPDFREFWSHISLEESEHAGAVRNLIPHTQTGQLLFKEGRFQAEDIQSSINHFQSLDSQTQKENYSMLQALDIAVGIEQSLLENQFFKVFEGDNIELKDVLDCLRTGTEEHLVRVKNLWAEEKARLGI